MSVLGEVSPQRFMAHHWQRAPLLVRGALGAAAAVVDGDTLAGLACDDEVESRLVLREPGEDTWRCEHGPFTEARFAALPGTDWTLLVQGVDRWLPEVAALTEPFDFLPRWRIDDVMVSYATPGGGVGPHFDHYDVFLVQAAGRRRWRLGQRCDAGTALREHPELRLLARFDTGEEHTLGPGDMLYVPAGLAHWGEAASAPCITCSVGFRAPSHAEILLDAAATVAATLPEDRRHRDTVAARATDPWRIDDAIAGELLAMWRGLDAAALESALARAFGCLVTAPTNPALIEAPGATGKAVAAGTLRLRHHPHSRFAYRALADGAELYVDGETHTTALAVARGICNGWLPAAELADAGTRALVESLVTEGSLEASPALDAATGGQAAAVADRVDDRGAI